MSDDRRCQTADIGVTEPRQCQALDPGLLAQLREQIGQQVSRLGVPECEQ